jgi:hypothetical protein
MTFHEQSDAKRFLVSKVLEQAERDGVELNAAERQILTWTGADFDRADSGVAPRPELGISEDEFEAKVAGLLRRALDRDLAADAGAESLYHEADAKLAEGDHYISIMLFDVFYPSPKKRKWWWPF